VRTDRKLPAWTLLLAAPLLGSLAARSARAGDGQGEGHGETLRLPLVALGGFKGDFGLPRCRAESAAPETAPDYARLVTLVDEVRAGAAAAGAATLAPLLLHSGDLAFPGALARYLVEQGEWGNAELMRLLGEIPYDAVAVGGLDLSLPAADLEPFFAAARAAELPFQAANLTCGEESPALPVCKATHAAGGIEGFRVVERGPVRIALLSAIDPSHEEEIAASNRSGVTFSSIEESVGPLVRRIREQKLADVVVLQVHARKGGQELDLLRLLVRQPGIDVVVLKRLNDGLWGKLPDEFGEMSGGWAVVPQTRTVVINSGRGTGEAELATLELRRSGDGWGVALTDGRLVDIAGREPDSDVISRISDLSQRFCADWGKPVNEGLHLSAPMEQDGFLRYVLDSMRARSGTEVALLNRGAVRNTSLLPLHDTLTRADVQSLLPFGGTLVTARLSGSDLESLAYRLGKDLVAAGLEQVDGLNLVNGRPVDWSRGYTVVMNRFLADGGDGILRPESLKRRRDVTRERGGAEEPLVDVVLDALREGRFVRRRTGLLDPTARFLDLHRRPLFRIEGSIFASYTKIAVGNPIGPDGFPVYLQGELTSTSVDMLLLEGRTQLGADTRNHLLGLGLLASYGIAKYQDAFLGTLESGDLIRITGTYEFSGFRALARGKGYVPLPFAEAQLQTEFSKPVERDWHRLQLTGIFGAKLRPVPPFSLKFGFNVRRELLEPGTRALPGFNVGYVLSQTDLFSVLDRPIQIESEMDWFYNDIGRSDIHEIRHLTRLYFSLLDKLFFTTSVQLYFYREDPVGVWGRYVDFTFGLSATLSGASQG
jgi:2',3'-cyclic-nucleotide 2'-phosphodiesterase (5'-nucleotidase family)